MVGVRPLANDQILFSFQKQQTDTNAELVINTG